jgi:hypothetical protein
MLFSGSSHNVITQNLIEDNQNRSIAFYTGSAQMNLPPIPGGAGLKMYFAYALSPPPSWNFVSNPVTIEIIP